MDSLESMMGMILNVIKSVHCEVSFRSSAMSSHSIIWNPLCLPIMVLVGYRISYLPLDFHSRNRLLTSFEFLGAYENIIRNFIVSISPSFLGSSIAPHREATPLIGAFPHLIFTRNGSSRVCSLIIRGAREWSQITFSFLDFWNYQTPHEALPLFSA